MTTPTGLVPGVPVVRAPHLPDGSVTLSARGPVDVVLLGTSPAGATAVRIVRRGLADVLAWLTDPPDMRTGEEILTDLRPGARPAPDPAGVLAGALLRRLTVREEGPCVWCLAWVVRYRTAAGPPAGPLACTPVHRAAAKQVPKQRSRPTVREDAAKAERARRARCPRPEKAAYRSGVDARDALRGTREKHPEDAATLNAYLCACAHWHVGNRRPGRRYDPARTIR